MNFGMRFVLAATVCGAVVSMVFPARVHAYSGGIDGRARVGCGGQGCHGTSENATADVSLDVTPLASGSLELDVTVVGPESTGINAGGFDLEAVSGKLVPLPEGTGKMQNFSSREAGHTASGNDLRTWTLRWDPDPEKVSLCTLDLFLAANAVNGDGAPSSADKWGNIAVTETLPTDGDTETPTGEIVSPRSDTIYAAGNPLPGSSPAGIVLGGVQIAIQADDDIGIDTVTVFDTDALSDGPEELGQAQFDPSKQQFTLDWLTTGNEPPGSHTLTVEIKDCAGGTTTLTREVVVL